MQKTASKETIMCAYKLCRVEFRYWGMQSKCERFIHEIGTRPIGARTSDAHDCLALRKTILRAHRQAWCWQDEYQGLTLTDIRRLEDETQRELKRRFAQFQNENRQQSLANAREESREQSNRELDTPVQRARKMSIENLNANRPKMSSFPVPPLYTDETSNDEFYDAECKIYSLVRSNREASTDTRA